MPRRRHNFKQRPGFYNFLELSTVNKNLIASQMTSGAAATSCSPCSLSKPVRPQQPPTHPHPHPSVALDCSRNSTVLSLWGHAAAIARASAHCGWDGQVEALIERLFDENTILESMKESGVDLEEMPLGAVTARPAPSNHKTASRSVRAHTLKRHYKVNYGSLYRCGKST